MTIPAAKGKNASYEARHKQAQDWPLVLASVNLDDGRRQRLRRQDRPLRRGADPLAERRRGEGDHRQALSRSKRPPPRARPPLEGAAPLSMNGYKVALTKTVVKRALLAAVGNRYWEEA